MITTLIDLRTYVLCQERLLSTEIDFQEFFWDQRNVYSKLSDYSEYSNPWYIISNTEQQESYVNWSLNISKRNSSLCLCYQLVLKSFLSASDHTGLGNPERHEEPGVKTNDWITFCWVCVDDFTMKPKQVVDDLNPTENGEASEETHPLCLRSVQAGPPLSPCRGWDV